MSNARGTSGLQRAFVLSADHPKYRLRLENKNTIGTHVGKAWLAPQWALGKFAGDQDDPFKEERSNKRLRMGSCSILVDSQIESVRKIKEAKEFAKAVKVIDAEVPTRLWNDRIKMKGVSQETRDRTFTTFWKAGHQRLLTHLVRDCVLYMKLSHGPDWMGFNARFTKKW
jgi:hypothetical protein